MPYDIKVCKSCGKKSRKSKRKSSAGAKLLTLNQEYGKHGYDATMLYAKEVEMRFAKKPKTFRKFLAILSDVQKADTNKVDVIVRLILLLDGHSDLILGFNAFLPDHYVIELQKDNAIIKVFEAENPDEDLVSRPAGASSTVPIFQPGKSHPQYSRLAGNRESFGYIRQVKETFIEKPEVYRKFTKILEDYHKQHVNEVDTVHKIIALFQKFPHLVFGFNEFLPPGYNITMHDEHSYGLQYSKDGSSRNMCIMLDDDF